MASISRSESRNIAKGLFFIAPWIVGFLAFMVYPLISSLYYSLTRYDVLRPPKFVGLENYQDLLLGDEMFRIAIGNTLYFVLIGVPAAFVTAFLLANLLNTNLRGRSIFRTIFFIPAITPAVASVMVWLWIYNTQYGLINGILVSLGMEIIPWLSSPPLAKPALIIMQCWAEGTAIVIFLAALQDVPRALYEAALVDGANALQRFWNITIPMCTPVMLFVLLTGLIGTFQAFTLPWLLTQGGPNNATELYSVYLYRSAFVHFKMGYASALAWILFVITAAFSIIVFRSSARWVYYRGE
jgi:multiple sugar transport system permease protein